MTPGGHGHLTMASWHTLLSWGRRPHGEGGEQSPSIRSFINSYESPVCGPELALKLENSAETSFIAQSSAPTRHQRQVPGEESESERGVITDTFKCGQ